MARWRGQARGGALGHRIFLFTLRRFGLRAAYFLLRFVTLYFCIFSRGSSRSTFFYFRRIHGFSTLKSLFAIYRNYYAFGQSIVDKYALLSGSAEGKFSYTYENEEYLHQLMEEGEGGILISAHLGNWDIAGHLLKRLKGRINIVMYENEKQRIKEALEPVLGKRSFQIIGVGEGMEHLIEIREALKRGELVCIHADRYMEGVRTIEGEFMGKKAKFPLGPFILASKFNAPTCFVFSCKDRATHYHFYSTAPVRYGSTKGSSAEESARQAFEDYLSVLERFMNHYPYQWFNFFPFWEEEKALEGDPPDEAASTAKEAPSS